MSKRTMTVYKCDLCGMELDGRDVLTFRLPVLARLFDEYGSLQTTVLETQEHDLCPTCADKLAVVEMDKGLAGPIPNEGRLHLRLRGDACFTPEQAIAAKLGPGRASGFQWHLMVDGAPEYGMNDYVVMGTRGALYVASEYSKCSQDGKGAYFYIPNRRDNFMDKKQVLAWAEIPPLEVAE